MGTPTTKRAMRQLSVREKISAVQRVHDGESKASVARMIGVPESTLRGWCKNEMKLRTMSDKGCSESPSPSPPLSLSLSDTAVAVSAAKRPRLDDMNDALWFWLRSQQSHEAPVPQAAAPLNNNHSSWFWKWYKEFGVGVPEVPLSEPSPPAPRSPQHSPSHSPQHSPGPDTDPEEPLPLVVRRNKDTKEQCTVITPVPVSVPFTTPVLVDSNKEAESEAKENTTLSEDEDEPPASAGDALKHGEKFLRWLECCSDPSVTAVQLLQFRYLLNNVKSCAERRAANKTRSTRSRRK